jgi:hypothetical protein
MENERYLIPVAGKTAVDEGFLYFNPFILQVCKVSDIFYASKLPCQTFKHQESQILQLDITHITYYGHYCLSG